MPNRWAGLAQRYPEWSNQSARQRAMLTHVPNRIARAHRTATPSDHAQSHVKPHRPCPSHRNTIRSCSIARETASSMPILLQHHRVMPNRMRKVVAHAHLAATSSCDAQWGTESCPGRIGPPNTRMQLTAFGARDRRYFKAILCRVPSAATDAQHVRPLINALYCPKDCNIILL